LDDDATRFARVPQKEALQGFTASPTRYLFPYRQQFVVGEPEMLEAIGLGLRLKALLG
jgi:hypothetical protein